MEWPWVRVTPEAVARSRPIPREFLNIAAELFGEENIFISEDPFLAV